MRHLFISLTAILLITTDSAEAQSLTDVTSSIRDGGGWVAIAIEGGEGSYSSPRVPTLNLKLNGCVTVWDELSGNWVIEATETVSGTTLLLSAEPGLYIDLSPIGRCWALYISRSGTGQALTPMCTCTGPTTGPRAVQYIHVLYHF